MKTRQQLADLAAGKADFLGLNTPELLNAYIDQSVITEAKSYLNDTDWIATKIAEAGFMGRDVESLKTQYADELAMRETARGLA